MTKRERFLLVVLAASAALWRLVLVTYFEPLGVEPDGLGMALVFWHPAQLQAQIPHWWAEMMPIVKGYWPPVYPFLNSIVGHLIGDPLPAGRVVSALAAMFLVVVVFFTVRLLTESTSAGLAGGLLAVTAPLAVAWDVRVRPETLFNVLFLLSIFYLLCHRRRGDIRSLSLALAVGGLAACVKFEAVALLPPIAWYIWRLRKKHSFQDLGVFIPALFGWMFAGVWFAAHGFARLGDYEGSLGLSTLAQLVKWAPSIVAVLPSVLTWPVAFLAAFGVFCLARNRQQRPQLVLMSYTLLFFLFFLSIHRDWTTRHLLVMLPLWVVLAAVGWADLPRQWGLRWVVLALAAAICLFSGVSWVKAEKDRWTEVPITAAVASSRCSGTIWSDDPYLMPYYLGRDVEPLDDIALLKDGDCAILHDHFGVVRHKRTVEKSLEIIDEYMDYEIIFQDTVQHRPLAGEVVDPLVLMKKNSLRDLGPWVYWDRKLPVTINAAVVLVHK